LYGLLDQIELCYARIEVLVRKLRDERKNKGDGEEGEAEGAQGIRTILIGHSVGAYIALEVIRLWSERCNRPTAASEGPEENDQLLWHPSAAILLMPTVIDLHKSPSGQLATPVLSTVPFLPQVVQLAATVIKCGLPGSWLSHLVSRVTGMQPGHGLESTVNFLLSEKGVKQALHLARDELATIRADRWGEEVWGAGDGNADGGNGLKIYSLFAKEDHWVADATRDEILKVRGGRGKFVVDEEGLVHAWPLKQSEVVAQTVVDWLREIIRD
jgi:pimeloyl-ACP methyl ester carboxylesterase